jgi:hypothetical protein
MWPHHFIYSLTDSALCADIFGSSLFQLEVLFRNFDLGYNVNPKLSRRCLGRSGIIPFERCAPSQSKGIRLVSYKDRDLSNYKRKKYGILY